jgi:hypothetical protein
VRVNSSAEAAFGWLERTNAHRDRFLRPAFESGLVLRGQRACARGYRLATGADQLGLEGVALLLLIVIVVPKRARTAILTSPLAGFAEASALWARTGSP